MKKKLLMIWATPFFSDRGCHIRIYNEIKYLSKKDFDIILTTYHLWNDIKWIKIKRIINIPWYKKTWAWASWHKLYLDFLLLILSIKEYFINKPKIIHAHLYEWLLIAYIIKIISFFNVKIIFDCQWSLAEEMMSYSIKKSIFSNSLYKLFIFIEKILLYLPDYTICSSKNSYNILREKYNINKNNVSILWDWVDLDLFKISLEEKEKLKLIYWIPKWNKVVTYTWWITVAKWVKELLDCIPDILKNNNKITFLIAWYWNLEEEYRNRYKNIIKNWNIIFLWRFSYFDLPKIISISNFCIEPKNWSSESSGKIYNYIAWNVPIICFNNDFNYSILWDSWIYIDNFLEIPEKINNNYKNVLKINSDILWKNLVEDYVVIYNKIIMNSYND